MKKLNDLREKMPDAMVYTYTYSPLIGLASETDPRGVTTYYEYDGANRLEGVYMQNGSSKEILNLYEYNHRNQ